MKPGGPIMVTVNGTAYPTQLHRGVQRFVPDPEVELLVELALQHSGSHPTSFYASIPEGLQAHPNSVVRYMVEQNETGYCSLNELVLALHRREINLDDWIEFHVLHGYSVSGLCDAVESQLSNMGLGVPYTDPADGEEYEDYSLWFTVVNPLWED